MSGNIITLEQIDERIAPTFGWAEQYQMQAQQLALDAARLQSCTADRLEELQKTKFFGRLWNAFSGKNREIHTANDRDLIELQRVSLRYIEMLNERDLLLAHGLIALKNNLLSVKVAEEETRLEVARMAQRVAERFARLEERVDVMEATQALHAWLLTVEDNDTYYNLPPWFRLFKMIQDFHALKGSAWNMKELQYLRSAIHKVGLPARQEFSLGQMVAEVLREVDSHSHERLSAVIAIKDASGELIPTGVLMDAISAPRFTAVHYLADSYSGTAHAADALIDALSISKSEAIQKIIISFLEKQGMDLNISLQLRDWAVEMLACMGMATEVFSVGKGALDADQETGTELSKNAFAHHETKEPSPKELGEKADLGDFNAVHELIRLGYHGDTEAQVLLGKFFFDFYPQEALVWNLRGAKAGRPVSQYLLARQYESVEGIGQNVNEAFSWMQKAASQGYHYALYYMSYYFMRGVGVAIDYKEAYSYLSRFVKHEEACENAVGCAYYAMGDYLLNTDLRKALWHYEMSSKYGCPYAEGKLEKLNENIQSPIRNAISDTVEFFRFIVGKNNGSILSEEVLRGSDFWRYAFTNSNSGYPIFSDFCCGPFFMFPGCNWHTNEEKREAWLRFTGQA